ncbi:MAG TPA: lipoyl(octanoyl) transferase LipB [Candidatus Thalassarchaeaceae archaeon]|jgi:lipoate-protein ligase B|nr:lipoyl(octanoyl) transferase LipB [Candidatus Thalassarchaeaceae archaeon]MDP6844141.1 lipoyl(octanoyl) transferase LipB [Candidatus Thalassarchaeaceae archaeon]HJM40769.1 lipoyl(octanoyl) transferase LipB [Candidatus Thalassarchaeaceae archaeon]
MEAQRVVDVRLLGHTDYHGTELLMRELQQQRLLGEIPDTILFCSHTEIVTIGPAARRDKIVVPADYPTTDVDRGGGITWHGPGQLVVYPIVKWDLEGEANVKHITSKLEQWAISALAVLGIEAGIDERMQGVWVQGVKIGSVGLAFKKWISRHGFTINFATPKGRVETLDGCGLSAGTTSSLDRLGFEISPDEITDALLFSMQDSLNRVNAKS